MKKIIVNSFVCIFGLILCYHSHYVVGDCSYPVNSHLALEQDLEILHDNGDIIVPLKEFLLNPQKDSIALTFDDGCDLDWIDFNHPKCGYLKSFKTILEDYELKYNVKACATSFVIASPVWRHYIAKNLMHDWWWKESIQSGLLDIQNHSYNHGGFHGNFLYVDSEKECRKQVDHAAEMIERRTGKFPDLFIAPWEQYSEYLEQYLKGKGIIYFKDDRLTHGYNWMTPEEFLLMIQKEKE